MAGVVSTDSALVRTAGETVAADALLNVRRGSSYVSRGGDKLAHALDAFAVDVRDRVVLDAGCSTGGFTDCVLVRGARHVHAVDVGYGQLAWSLREDPRVSVRERTNVRALVRDSLDPPASLAVVDLAFTSLTTVVAHLASLLVAPADLVVLVKPQFEASREQLDGGVVRDGDVRRSLIDGVAAAAAAAGLDVRERTDSPIAGADGNREAFLWLRARAAPR